jgi:hypothetical protein
MMVKSSWVTRGGQTGCTEGMGERSWRLLRSRLEAQYLVAGNGQGHTDGDPHVIGDVFRQTPRRSSTLSNPGSSTRSGSN